MRGDTLIHVQLPRSPSLDSSWQKVLTLTLLELPTDETWKDRTPLAPNTVDKLISQCDRAVAGSNQPSSSPFGAFLSRVDDIKLASTNDATSYATPSAGIDDVSRYLEHIQTPVSIQEYTTEEVHPLQVQDGEGSLEDSHIMCQLDDSMIMALPLERPIECAGHGLPSRYAFLLDVYVTLVTPALVPMHDGRNPWLQYPAIALHFSRQEGRNHLLHALMAHAAFSLSIRSRRPRPGSSGPYDLLSELEGEAAGTGNGKMDAQGYKLYSLAATEMRARIIDGSIGCLDLLTTILSLLLIEV